MTCEGVESINDRYFLYSLERHILAEAFTLMSFYHQSNGSVSNADT
jgi:hypothetical protein